MAEDQKASEPEEQKKFANAGDDVEAHKKGSVARSDDGKDDDDGDDVEAHVKAGGHL